jgi:lipoprotein-anchoring transpeptidase ErfK/SrfK
MQRLIFVALIASALAPCSALAQPMSIVPHDYAAPPAAPPPQYAAAQPQTAPQVIAAPTYAAAPGPDLGGGFIEYLFSGGRTEHGWPVDRPRSVAPARPLQPAMQPVYPTYAPLASPPVVQASLPPAATPIDPKYMKQTVAYDGDEKPGTIIINTPEKFLYLVEEGGKALRYGIGVGRPGFTWAGVHHITAKREWPEWTPPKEMLERRPDLPRYMAGGPANPLGARALYIGSTLYRIHGTNEPWTIGKQVSSGCIRLRDKDVIDLYDRVKVGAKVVVI